MSQLLLPVRASPPRFPSEPIVRAAEVEGGYRWTMTRAWGSGPCILWCPVNPSDADAKKDDPTTLRMMGFSYRWGFGSMVVVNVYPFIASKMEALLRWRRTWKPQRAKDSGFLWELDRSPYNAWLRNIDVVREQIKKTQVHVAAWGNGTEPRTLPEYPRKPGDIDEFLDEVTFDYEKAGRIATREARVEVDWQCLAINEDGTPRHPLARGAYRVPDAAVLKPWRRR